MGIFKRILNVIQGGDTQPSQPNQSKGRIFATIEESQNNKIGAWNANRELVSGLKFCATLQLRTPLRVLLRHGEMHTDINSEPPKIANEMWEGIWIIKTKTWNELGLDLNEVQESTMASEIGQIRAGDYLPFLIAVREIVELNDSIDSRINKLREKAKGDDWRPFIRKHGGINKVIAKFFPRFIDTIPKINEATIEDLSSLSLDTPNIIAGATDEALLTVKGIGQAKLKVIRDYCAGVTSDRDAKRLESVTR